MARTKRKAVRQRPKKPVQMPWRDGFGDLFRLGMGWNPPATVQVRQTVKGFTFVAIFRDEQSRALRLTTRVKLLGDGAGVVITDEQLLATYRIGGRQ